MSTTYSAASYNTIDEEVIYQVCPLEFDAFTRVVFDDELADFARDLERGEETKPTITKAFRRLQRAFKKKTGLDLAIAHVGEGLNGSTVSEETFWHIDNAIIPNPDYVKFCEKMKIPPTDIDWFLGCG